METLVDKQMGTSNPYDRPEDNLPDIPRRVLSNMSKKRTSSAYARPIRNERSRHCSSHSEDHERRPGERKVSVTVQMQQDIECEGVSALVRAFAGMSVSF